MTSTTDTAQRWLDVLASGEFAGWDTLVATDFSMHAPFMPGEPEKPTIGRNENRARVEALWRAWKTFDFRDIEIHCAADDPNLVFITARSQAMTVWGAPYANRYVIRLLFRNGQVAEHIEFMDPAPVVHALEGHY